MTSNDTIRLRPTTLVALGLESRNASRGNVAAHLWRLAHATSQDPLAGINLGWKDQQESTDFLVRLVQEVDEYGADLYDIDEIPLIEDANAIPSSDSDALAAATQLNLSLQGNVMDATAWEKSLSDIARIMLYEEAYELVNTLISAVQDEYDKLEDEGDDDE